MRQDLDFTHLPIRHGVVHLFYCKKLNRITLVSGDSPDEAIKRLVKDSPVWSQSRSYLGGLLARSFESALLLDEEDVPYSPTRQETKREK